MDRTKLLTALGLSLMATTATGALAADGAFPLWEPTTITQPGKYVLTRNIVSGTNPVLTVASDNVHVDLNGFTIEGDANIFAADVVLISGVQGVTLENGTIAGGGAGVRLSSGSTQFALRHLTIRGGRTGIGIASGSARGIIESNIVQDASDDGIAISGTGIQVRGNVISSSINGITIANCSSCQVVENTVQNPAVVGIGVNEGSGNLIVRNTVSAAGIGLRVRNGGYHHVEGNVLADNTGYGMHLQTTSFQNLYRANTARNNGGAVCPGVGNSDFCDEGAANTSHGDNYMPDKR